MYCKKCGAALPNTGFVTRIEVNLLSDRYSREPIKRDYKKQKENKYLGAILIVLVVIILVILAILKVM